MKLDRTSELVVAQWDAVPIIKTVYSQAEQAITVNNTYTDITSMTLTFTVPLGNSTIMCWYTHRIKMDSAHWEHHYVRLLLDGVTSGGSWGETKDANPVTSQYWLRSYQGMFTNVAAGTHTIKAQHYTASDLNVKIYNRRLSLMIGY